MDLKRPIRVLMLEDEARDAEINERALKGAGLEVECLCVRTRQEFKEALDQFNPDIVLTDYNLPGFDGRSALEILRKDYSETPAIVVTGALGDEAAVDLLKAGAADYVLKDRPARLASAVKKALDEEYQRRERLAASRELESKVVLLKTQQETSIDGILVVDEFSKIISENRRFVEMWHIPPELQGSVDDTLLLKFVTGKVKNPAEFSERVAHLYAHPKETSREEIETTDGLTFDRYSAPMFDSQGAYLGRIWSFRDITEQRTAERQFRLFRTLLDKSNERIEVVDPETLKILDVNERVTVDLGYTREEFLSKHIFDFDVALNDETINKIREGVERAGNLIFESRHRRKDGTEFPVEVGLSYVSSDRGAYLIGVVRDITERRHAQQALQESEVRFRTLIEDASDPVAIIEGDGKIAYCSPATVDVSGFTAADLLGGHIQDHVHPDDAERVARHLASVIENPTKVQRFITRMRHKDNTWRTIEAAVQNRLGVSPIDGLVVSFRDVTVRERSIRALAAIRATDAAMVRASDEEALAEQICRIMVEIGGYRMAWFGSPEQDERKSISVIAKAAQPGAHLDIAKINLATTDETSSGDPTARAVRTAKTQVSRESAEKTSTSTPGERVGERGYVACAAIPLTGREGVFGVISLYSNDPLAFDDEEVKLLEQLSADLSYGIKAMRERKQHALDLERLEQIMETTIQAIAATVEKRDPYTAGHERRVAQLCVAIAQELNLDPERIRGIQLAAMIHDVGKIEIPAEILAKPRRLTEIEYSLVKSHPQAGYEILRNIDFPWPIAEMVQQHHEKLDGSGYPNGLCGDQILLESRIIAVADVVEAISSHRPYRPGWGLDVALAEVSKGRGIQYDSTAVDACVRLFREKGFAFK